MRRIGLFRYIAPRYDLRKWYSHDPKKWKKFKATYFKELDEKRKLIDEELIKNTKRQTITLLYSTKEKCYNNVAALKEYIEKNYEF